MWMLREIDGAGYIITTRPGTESKEAVEGRVRRALAAAEKYSLVANSVKSEIAIEPRIVVGEGDGDG